MSCIAARRSMGSVPASRAWRRPVRPRQPGLSLRPFTLGDGKLMAQHQDLGVLPPRLPSRRDQQRHGTGDDEEDQLPAHEPWIIARPDWPHWLAMHRTRDCAGGVRRSICPGGAGFRHPQQFTALRYFAVDGPTTPPTKSRAA